jgi:hypothetical protein
MTRYLPPFDELCELLGVDKKSVQKSGPVEVRSEVLLALIKAAVAGLAIDAQWYRQRNSDVAVAFEGRPDIAFEKHFKETGYFESRQFPSIVDVEFYRRKYPDLATAIKAGELSDLKTHFHEVGVNEQRVPSAEAEEEMRAWGTLAKTHSSRRPGTRAKIRT